VLAVVLGLPSVFQAHIDEEQPIVVELVNIGPKTLATMKAFTPPKPKAPPKPAKRKTRKERRAEQFGAPTGSSHQPKAG